MRFSSIRDNETVEIDSPTHLNVETFYVKFADFIRKFHHFRHCPPPLISITYYCCKSKWNISQQLTLLFRTPFCRCFLWFFPNPWVLPPPLNNHVPDRKYLTKYVNCKWQSDFFSMLISWLLINLVKATQYAVSWDCCFVRIHIENSQEITNRKTQTSSRLTGLQKQ